MYNFTMEPFVFNELTKPEFDFFYKSQTQFAIVKGLIGLLRHEIASDLASNGSFQSEMAEEFCPDNSSIEDYACMIAGSGSEQYEIAEILIERAFYNGMLKEKLFFYECISFDKYLERYFPNFTILNRYGRMFYIESEKESTFTFDFLDEVYSSLKINNNS